MAVFGWQARGAEPTLDAIREQYTRHQQQLRQLYVHWRTEVEVLKPGSGEYANSECRAVVKGDKRAYEIERTSVSGPPIPEEERRQAMSYDGEETRILLFPELGRIFPGDERRQFDAPDDFLALQGYPKSDFKVWLLEEDLRSYSCDVAMLLGGGEYEPAGTREVDGVACIEAAGPLDRICFDPDRGYAILQREYLDRKASNVRRRDSLRDLEEVLGGLWLAREIVTECFDGGQPTHRNRLEVVHLEVEEVPDDVFSLDFERGTYIGDMRHFSRTPDGHVPIVRYRIPVEPEDLDAVVSAGVERVRQAELEADEGSWLRWALVAGNIAVLVILGTILIVRSRLKASS